MKKTLQFLAIIFVSILNINAQNSIESCSGNTGKSALTLQNAIRFNNAGINLSKYNWDNPDVNCHINNILRYEKKAKIKQNILAPVILLGGMSIGGTVYTVLGGDEGLVAFSALSILSLGGSISMLYFAHKDKQKSTFHFTELSSYYYYNVHNKATTTNGPIKRNYETPKNDKKQRTNYYQQEETKEPKLVTCSTCFGGKTMEVQCETYNCENGKIKTTCHDCQGNYKNGNSPCMHCNTDKGCSYCGHDGLACEECNKGKIESKHLKCNGKGKITVTCDECDGIGKVKK